MKSILSILLLVTLVSCGESNENSAPQPTANSVPNSFFVTDRPSNVKDLVEVKKTAKKDDEVTFLARVGGRKNASFVPSLAMMIVADPSLVSCELMGDSDHCETPEDYCCEDPDKLAHSLATIRFMENDIDVYPFSVEGNHGLETLKYVVVSGKVKDINENGLFIVDANQIWVGDKPHYGAERAGSGE